MAEVFEGAVDRGLEGIVACTTKISFIVDATLNYRGYTIEDLAAHSTFEETIFLLWNDRLPKKDELEKFKRALGAEMALDPAFVKVLKEIPTKGVHPMAWLRTAVSAMALWDKEAQDSSQEANERKAIRLTAKMGSLVTAFERIRTGKDIIAPNPSKSLAWNFFYTLTGQEPDAEMVRMFDVCLILHADHELNCSAFAMRVTASSLSDIYSAAVSAISALKGPLHGGANEQVMVMLKDIGTMDRARTWVKEALENKQKVMGFGHRVYKNGDPRAKILRQMSEQLTKKIGQPHWYEMSALIDDTMQGEKGLLPNVDFYSATVYYSMGIPIDLFTPIFAASRVSGWIAHAFEQWTNNRIYRPRGKWAGREGLTWVPAEKR
ncbi:MAG: citrate synthase [Bdellovibrionaceae bacterium]|nr:citrate synthase [Pseudobdellovibrionaceae bacterium]